MMTKSKDLLKPLKEKIDWMTMNQKQKLKYNNPKEVCPLALNKLNANFMSFLTQGIKEKLPHIFIKLHQNKITNQD